MDVRLTKNSLAEVNVELLDGENVGLECKICGEHWSPDILPGGRLARGWWKCPKNPDHSQRHESKTIISENSIYLELVGIIKNWPKSRLDELRVFTLLWGIQNAELSPEIKADWQRDLDAFVDYKRRTLGKSARRKFEAMLENNKYMTYREVSDETFKSD